MCVLLQICVCNYMILIDLLTIISGKSVMVRAERHRQQGHVSLLIQVLGQLGLA